MKTKVDSFYDSSYDKINKGNKPLARLTKNKRGMTQITTIRNEKGDC